MKQKTNARQKREAEAQRKKAILAPSRPSSVRPPEKVEAPKPAVRKPAVRKPVPLPDKSPEEEAREFLEYLEQYGTPAGDKEYPQTAKKKTGGSGSIPRLDLEDGMPVVSDALSRMNIGLQEMRYSRIKAVKLVHGYGSTGRGGKICIGVRDELASMKRKKLIRDYIPGEEFGSFDAASRKLAEQNKSITKDPDYGRTNHGITIVVL